MIFNCVCCDARTRDDDSVSAVRRVEARQCRRCWSKRNFVNDKFVRSYLQYNERREDSEHVDERLKFGLKMMSLERDDMEFELPWLQTFPRLIRKCDLRDF